MVLRHGAPRSLITDQGKCFVAEFTQRILAALEVEHKMTTSYHPQTNGLCERLNHTLADMLSMYVDADHKNWDSILPYVTFAYNTSRQESSGYTPFFLLYGREVTFPKDYEFFVKAGPQENQDTPKGISHRFEKIRELVTQRLHQVHLRQKAYYDANRRETQYGEGDLVLIYKPYRKVGKSKKLLHRWLGPYLVVRRLSDLNYEVKKFRGSSDKTEIAHVVNIKKFNVRSLSPTQDPPDEPSEQDTRTDTTKRKPGRPRKLIAPASEPDTATAEPTSPPITQPEEQPVTSPQQRPSRTRRLPKRYDVLSLYLLTTLLGRYRMSWHQKGSSLKKDCRWHTTIQNGWSPRKSLLPI